MIVLDLSARCIANMPVAQNKNTPHIMYRALDVFFGGDVCESNTPKTFCAPHNGFEGRGPHQGTIRLRSGRILTQKPFDKRRFLKIMIGA